MPAAKYLSYAERLASWGYVVLLYDKVEVQLTLPHDTATCRCLWGCLDAAAASAEAAM